MLEQTLDHLQALVSFDTRNPPRAITTGGIFDYLRDNLPGFNVEVIDPGAGAVSLYAVRGTPKYLFNVHLDTVPDSPHWLTAKGATYAQSADWGVAEAEGFIKLFGMSSTLYAQVNRG